MIDFEYLVFANILSKCMVIMVIMWSQLKVLQDAQSVEKDIYQAGAVPAAAIPPIQLSPFNCMLWEFALCTL